MRYFLFSIFFYCISLSFSQVIAEGDTVLCQGQEGDVGVTLTATSYAVDLTDSNIYTDDIFGGVVNMGFDFEFYGNTYNQVVLASNNYLSFNTGNAGGYSDWTIGAAIPTTTEPETQNGILCPWQDIYPGVNGNGIIAYATTGVAPNRVFIVSFCGIPMFSCTDICYSSQIKLFETTNIIETHIAQKVLCTTWNGGAAIHGLHNEDGTIAHVVTGLDGVVRNYPNEWTCENDGWQFIPNGDNDYTIENIEFAPAVAGTDIIWQDEFGNQIGTGGEILVFPGGNVTYTAGASLCGNAGDWCGFEGGIEGDDVTITFEGVDISSVDITNAPCDNPDGGSISVVADGTGSFEYVWSTNGSIIPNQNSSILQNIPAGNYQLTVITPNGCETTEDIFVDTDGNPVTISNAGQDFSICGTDTTLVANPPLDGESGLWTLVSGPATPNITIVSNASFETDVENLGVGVYVFAWTLENECGASTDQVTITVIDGMPTILSPESVYCLEPITLIAEVENGEGNWTVFPSEGVDIDDPFSVNTFAEVEEYGSYTFSFEGCNGTDSHTVEMSPVAPVLSGPEEVYCLETFQVTASVDGDPGYWTAVGPGNVVFSDSTSLSPMISVDDYGIYDFFYSGCGLSSVIEVELVSPNPIIQDPGIIYCSFETEINVDSDFDGFWSIGDVPNGSTVNIESDQNLAFVNVSDYGDYEIIFSSCGVSDTINISFQMVEPLIVATDHQNCLLTIDLYAVTPVSAGLWEQVSGPSVAEITDPYSNSTQATVAEFGMYSFTFTSCDSVANFDIGISCPMTVPNGFSPNGDGLNDFFIIPDLNENVYTQSIFYVYNIWGGVVYLNHDYGISGEWWDGKMIFHNRPFSSLLGTRDWDDNQDYVSNGVYFYTLEVYNNTSQEKEFYSGNIMIVSKEK